MSLKAKHPQYTFMLPKWTTATHVYDGEETVKEQGKIYLPPTAGMVLDGMTNPSDIGYQAYQAYKARAVFHDFMGEGVRTLIGLLHQKPATITLPTRMEPLRAKATAQGESLQAFLRRINESQLVTGRLGLLGDFPTENLTNDALPYISLYSAQSGFNWDTITTDKGDLLNLVVLNESGPVRDGFQWKEQEKYRVLELKETGEGTGEYIYSQGEFEGDNYLEESMTTPMYKGATLDVIPFVFINSKDVTPSVDNVPLKGLVNLTLAIYRGEADYRQNLYMQGQETLVIVGGIANTEVPDSLQGGDTAVRTGAGSRIDVDLGGDAKYIGVSAAGLSEQREALTADKAAAEGKAGQMVAQKNSGVESGDALKTRMAAQTATLNEIALSSAEGLQTILRYIARWMGIDEKEVTVEPNLEFSNFELAAADIVQLVTARKNGAPISLESIHTVLKDRGITKLDFEAELKKIAEEDSKYGEILKILQGLGTEPEPTGNNPQGNSNSNQSQQT